MLLSLHGCGQHQPSFESPAQLQGQQEAAAAALGVLLRCSSCVSVHLHSCNALFGIATTVCMSCVLAKLLRCLHVVWWWATLHCLV